jgi:hypothetical protein
MTLLEAIQACAPFTHKLPGSIHGELRGRRVLEGIELDATDGANAIRVLVPNTSLDLSYQELLPYRWTMSHAEAKALDGMGLLVIDEPVTDGVASSAAKIGKSGKPGKAKSGPIFRELSDESEQGRKWATLDRAIAEAMRGVSPQAKVKHSELVGALEPLDGSAEIILSTDRYLLDLEVKFWRMSLATPDVAIEPSLPIRLSVAPLWTALSSMEGDTVTLSWASLPEDSSATAETHREGGPLLVECGGVSFLTMPLREVGLIKAS